MGKRPDRQKFIQELSDAAKKCGFQKIRDDVGRQAVLDFVQRVRQSAGPESAQPAFASQKLQCKVSSLILLVLSSLVQLQCKVSSLSPFASGC